jgi:lipopolysaccharide/colanic/teichoic acid biosynthesis glycosyltransferase
MSAHQQSDLQNANPLPVGAWAPASETTAHVAQVRKSVPKSRWARIFGRPGHLHPVVDEDLFLHTLAVERKRSERSGNPFLLVLLKSDEVLQGAAGEKVIRQFERGVFSLIRDIDVAGWYEHDAALGVIFTEISGVNEEVIAAILKRLSEAISRSLAPEDAAKIEISCHTFPEKPEDANGEGMRFYPDVPRTERRRWPAHLMKRTIDLLGSLFALALLSPVFLAIGTLIKLTSDGPVFFRQTRVGQYGKTFTFLKFRSMYVNNDPKIHQEYVAQFITGNQAAEVGAPVFKIKNDPRVTRIGRFLRRTSLDELPQFFNVLKGEMSLVGPRPPLAYEVEKYDSWHRRRVVEVKPGITGLWQVNGRSKVTFDEMVRLDLKYARKWSIAMDLKILWLTPKAMLSGEGAY